MALLIPATTNLLWLCFLLFVNIKKKKTASEEFSKKYQLFVWYLRMDE